MGKPHYEDIVEIVENENGIAVKYADGTMICRNKILGNSFSCTQVNGNYYRDSNSERENIKTWTFPQPFISTDDLVISAIVSSKAYSMTSLGDVTAEEATVYCVLPYSVASVQFNWHLAAIGRWK